MKNGSPISIDDIIVDPPLFAGGPAKITVYAHSIRGGPLTFDVTASEGTIESTDEPNVFLWYLPKPTEGRGAAVEPLH